MNPYPASAFTDTSVDYIKPDVYVRKVKGRWVVSHKVETLPEICINQDYADMHIRFLCTMKGAKHLILLTLLIPIEPTNQL